MKIPHFTRTLLAAATLIAVSLSASADALYGRVVAVADGDTVTVLGSDQRQHKIRLMGIDAPEKKQPYGSRSKQSISDLVFNRQVQVEYDKKDKYGRTVGKIIVNGIDANLEQVTTGMAWHYKQYQREQSASDRAAYADAENEARAVRRGLWQEAEPTPPWDWRRQQKTRKK